MNLEDFYSIEQRIYIAKGKFRKARWVSLSGSTSKALRSYMDKRLLIKPVSVDSPLLLNERSRRLHHCTVNRAFRGLLNRCDIRHDKHTGPRVHDLRHTFAAHRLFQWYRDGKDVNARLPWLSTYMGHVDKRVLTQAEIMAVSMGPGHFCPGNGGIIMRQGQVDSLRFNGAGAFLPRKCSTRILTMPPAEQLQWGRGISAPEMSNRLSSIVAPPAGFNGAGAFLPRKCGRYDTMANEANGFNGAGAFLPRKWRPRAGHSMGGTSFNGAGAFLPRK